ncbi:MAG TPA: hypothetical protein VK400_16580 [Pyrinomonadaceae bacterium]|nr:hypothetical protein [Pyrinomonadaceae bacterium]
MSKHKISQYEDFIKRITVIAAEHQALLENTSVSMPVPVRNQAKQEGGYPVLLAFLYVFDNEDDEENPEIFQPYARIQLQLDGEEVDWKIRRHDPNQSSAGSRFTGIAADMEPNERAAFFETYYELLTSDEGLLGQSRSSVEPTIVPDLCELFYAMVEAPFLPLYRQFADEFLNFIGTPSSLKGI